MPVKDEGMIMTTKTKSSNGSREAFDRWYKGNKTNSYRDIETFGREVFEAAISSVSTGKIEGWKLTTGHKVKLVDTKPQCDIDCWQPLFTYQPDQSARIAELKHQLYLCENLASDLGVANDSLEAENTRLRGLLLNIGYKARKAKSDDVRVDVKSLLSEIENLTYKALQPKETK